VKEDVSGGLIALDESESSGSVPPNHCSLFSHGVCLVLLGACSEVCGVAEIGTVAQNAP
jgi:hypothetical protein